MVIVLALLMSPPAGAVTPERAPVMLAGHGVEVGVVPRLAGRIVIFRRADGPNALLADPATWGPGERVPPLSAAGWDFKPYNGHIVWIGPQAEWWAHQELAADKRTRRDNWPPDPWGEYAPFTIASQSADTLTLSGPPSPVTGLQLRKEVRIEAGGSVRITVSARNTRTQPVRWDLWSNTRVPGPHRVFVPVAKDSAVRIERSSSSPWTQTGMSDTVVDGWFTFRADEPPPTGIDARVAKAYLTPARGLLAAFGEGQVFLKRFALTPAAAVAPGQAPVEVFQLVHRDSRNSLLELEAHGPYTDLKAGAVMSFEETWALAPDGGAADDRARAALLNRLVPER